MNEAQATQGQQAQLYPDTADIKLINKVGSFPDAWPETWWNYIWNMLVARLPHDLAPALENVLNLSDLQGVQGDPGPGGTPQGGFTVDVQANGTATWVVPYFKPGDDFSAVHVSRIDLIGLPDGVTVAVDLDGVDLTGASSFNANSGQKLTFTVSGLAAGASFLILASLYAVA